MDFTPELAAFQGAILSADNVHQFSRLSAKGGNEDQINYVVECIKNHLKRGNYITDTGINAEKESQVRYIALYIIVNSELRIVPHMGSFQGINTVMFTAPIIPKCLMCELMWNLHMDKIIWEIIAHSYPKLSIEFAAAFINHFKYSNPLECIHQVKLIASSCYLAVCRLCVTDLRQVELRNLATAAHNNFQKCVKYYSQPPNNHKLSNLSTFEHYKYLGRRLYSLFLLIDECLTHFSGKLDTSTSFYDITYKDSNSCLKAEASVMNICDVTNDMLKETLDMCNNALLDVCKELVMEVSVEVFCCWSEIEEHGKSMQQTNGEICYKVRNKLLGIQSLCEHPLLSMIELIARKPAEMHDIINMTDEETILNNINKNDADSINWIVALAFKDNVCKNIQLLNVIESNLNKYNDNNCHKLYVLLKKHLSANEENDKEYIESLCIKVFRQCTLETKYKIIDEHFENNNFSNMTEMSNFEHDMTEIFNKLIASQDGDLLDVLTVFVQNPRKVFTKIFLLAIENSKQSKIMFMVLKLLEKYSNFYHSNETEPCIIKIIQETMDSKLDTKEKQECFSQFMWALKQSQIVTGSKLLLLIVMPSLHKALLNKDVSKTNVPIKLLSEVYTIADLLQYRAPMLAMVAQVLDMIRWRINTFSSEAVAALNSTLELQNTLFSTYDGSIPDNERSWLKSKLAKTQPLNMYYYRSLWNPLGSNFLEIVTGKQLSSNNVEEIESIVSQIITSCTQEEWCEIWHSLQVIDDKSIMNVFGNSLAAIVEAERSNRTQQTWACILYCMRNFIHVTRYIYLDRLNATRTASAVSILASLVLKFEEDKQREVGNILMPLFGYLMATQDKHSLDMAECLRKTFVNTSLKDMFSNMFSNGN